MTTHNTEKSTLPQVAKTAPSSVSSYLALVEELKKIEVDDGNYGDFIFRGQRTDELLIPRIARFNSNRDIRESERAMLDEFDRISPPFREFEAKNGWGLIAMAQHHGLPTRLLDWSESALTALWFCVHKAPKKDKKGQLMDGVVWVLKTCGEHFMPAPSDDTSFANKPTCIFRPLPVSRRIIAQSGLFTFHGAREGKIMPLEREELYRDRLHKIVIPASAFKNILHQLVGCGVHHVSLFPDLDGLARHIESRYFIKK